MTTISLSRIAAALATAVVLVTLAGGAQAASRSPVTGAAPVSGTTSVTTANARWGWGRGYGRGWCYWHPYTCYFR